VISAAVLLPVALFCIWRGGVAFGLLITAASVATGTEWNDMAGPRRTDWRYALLPFALFLACASAWAGWLPLGLACLAAGGLAMMAAGPGTPAKPVPGMPGLGWLRPPWAQAFGFLYLGPAAIALPWLRAGPAGLGNILFLLCVVWASDIGAYIVGRMIGGPKLAPAISPGKTRSGAVGGLIAASLAGLAVARGVSVDPPVVRVLILAALLGILAQAGDLLESAFKRHFGVKDSGTLIPGHGGVLDRLDAVLSVAPAAAILALLAGQGEFLWR
jgi:phosphatidate cytidylyltransferase